MRFSIVSFLIGILIASGIAELMKPEHKTLRRTVKAYLAKPFQNNTIMGMQGCEIPIATKVPQGAVIVVGHAYGSPQAPYKFLGADLTSLLEQNKTYIAHVVFTGDVFGLPSKKRWKRLKSYFDAQQINFTVAPGNHDVGAGDNTRRDIFLQEMGDVHKSVLNLGDHVLIVDDSTRTDWRVSDDLIDLVQDVTGRYPARETAIVRHHIPVVELERLANSNAYKSDALDNVQGLSERFGDTNITIISGDSGAFARLPRSTCHTYKNLTVYLNGVGRVEGDEVLMLYEGKISRFPL